MALQVATYNGFTFPHDYTRMEEFTAHPVQDSAKRTVSHVAYQVALKTLVTGAPTDRQVVDAIGKLCHQAGRFTLKGRGIGDIDVGGNGRMQDVLYGPAPEVISLKPVGTDRACELVWRVSFSIPCCRDAVIDNKALEFNFRVTYDIDRYGLTKRTYSGHVKIPGVRKGPDDRKLTATADSFREDCVPPPMPGFRRIPGQFEIDEAKTTLRFSVIDEELGDNPPPPGIIEAKASHNYSSSLPGMLKWSGTISAEYTLAKATPASTARDEFFKLCKQRLSQIVTDPAVSCIVPMGFTCSEPDLYAPIMKLSYSWVYSVSCPLETILRSSMLGQPVATDPKVTGTASAWKLWMTSMVSTLGARGSANVIFRPAEDAIIDICSQEQFRDLKGGPRDRTRDLRGGPVNPFPTPTEANSWLSWRNRFRLETDSGVSVMKTLPESVQELHAAPRRSPSQFNRSFGVTASSLLPSSIGGGGGGKLDNVQIQNRVSDTLYLFMEGTALRAGFPIPVPSVEKVGGATVIPVNRRDHGEGFAHEIVGNFGVPIYAAKWRLRYVLKEMPISFPVPPNPILGG